MYRSENNFGSSSQVPGASSKGALGGSGAEGKSASSDQGTGAGNGSEQSFGLTAGELTDSGNTSPAANISLLLLILVVAGGVGVVLLRARHTSASR
jgi:hypothetical protein